MTKILINLETFPLKTPFCRKKMSSSPKMTVPVRKKGITSVLLSSFANKDNSKIERVTFENRAKSNATASNEFYIGKAIHQSHLKLFSNFITDIKFRILISYFHTTKQSPFFSHDLRVFLQDS